jgi:quercetin dioxygenase-like cupin family protein
MVDATASGRLFHVVGEDIRTLGWSNGAGAYEIFEVTGPQGSGPPSHTHPWNEAYYVLSGKLEILSGDAWSTYDPGSFIYIPARTIHAYRIASETARFLTITDPPGAGRFFEDLNGRTDINEIVATAMRHDLTVHMP